MNARTAKREPLTYSSASIQKMMGTERGKPFSCSMKGTTATASAATRQPVATTTMA